ncbi:MAG: N-acetyltransferase [Oscillospiraceae bacterium]|nr:N-acetyltransferase [Oscillospiraceae bacterium]
MNIKIFLEEEKDFRRVEEITRLAFSYPGRVERGGIGCPFEHWMVNELRRRDGYTDLSLVAKSDDEIIGHIICSKAEVRTENKTIPVLNIGPISVLPEYQKKGVGKALIYAMIEKAKMLGHGAILFWGRPEYYPQFGFVAASGYGITDRDGHASPAFFAMELIEGYLSDAKGGKYYESDIYDDSLNKETVKAFDKIFMENNI